ncbi:sugar phosphate isomerase/epimerase [Chloroflexi bacterium TSY]|nr:sugar phosphate isomerase/epimerase [Chloroflexi bacterium TSY]
MSHFILSCTTCATRQPWRDEIEECFIHAPKAGYRAWGIAGPVCWTPGLSQWIDLKRIRQRAEEVGLTQCTEVYSMPFPTDSVELAQTAARQIARNFDIAETLGSPLVVLSGGKRQPGGLEATIAGLQALLPLIEDRTIRLALEPHYRSQIMFLEDYDAIFEQIDSPQIGMTLDSGHFHSANVNWRGVIDRHADRILNFHVKDHISIQSVALGAGEVDLRGYIETLHTINYVGALAVELEVVDFEHLIRYGAEAYTYLSEMVADVTGRSA